MNHGERERLFLELFHQNKASIQRLCWGYLDSPHDAEDLFQEIMANVWNSLPSFRGEARDLIREQEMIAGDPTTSVPVSRA